MAWVCSLLWCASALALGWVRRRVGNLRQVAPAERCPALSIILAARNEAAGVEAAARSLLALDYPNLTVVAVDDRSDDGTGDLLRALGDPRLRVVRIDDLPEGWLGKTHALWEGARVAPGEVFLFTDADVHFAPDCLRRAVQALEGVDHLVAGPRMVCQGLWEHLFVSFFGGAFFLRFRPDLAGGPDRRYAMGIGAFNMVRRSAYFRCGGHQRLRLHVLEDMGLGVLLKRKGFRQRYLDAGEQVWVRWLEGGPVHGLEKNAYAGMGYSPWLTLAACTVFVGACLGPLSGGWAPALLGLAGMLGVSWQSRDFGPSPWSGLGYPVAGLLFSYAVLRSAWLAERRGGIRWRGTFYPLRTLREHTLEAL